ncbi:type II toxin-antitoxin system HicB family antitoxin [Geminocystis sp. GBBB08]|uniref:type II toxin-antitoxin system HicB family antitoxin n=1 Tax=Geminocystis sp. GBBB08 TaxID=2604140 RepID=UPI0027E228B8|nr:type II toxin-antitoxin system HicB family antitoxin [Geminocystis sp. GBBB08]MBL1209973.1 type II toxin-antitoxin system HicB family antitoxin [Geminocystis sp. GBBB08]
MKVKAIIHKAEEEGYWAEVPIFHGCYTQGETMEEVLENLKEVISLYAEEKK